MNAYQYATQQVNKQRKADYENHCKDCEGEDCVCCEYNPAPHRY